MTLTRTTPLRKKAAKKRRTTSPRCSNRQCHQRAVAAGFCISHAEKRADDLFSLWIRERDAQCTAEGVLPTPCRGRLQCAHVIGRRKQTTRFDPANAHGACEGHHQHVDQHESLGAKYRWAVSRLGEDGWARLMERSRITTPRLVAVTAALEWLGEG